MDVHTILLRELQIYIEFKNNVVMDYTVIIKLLKFTCNLRLYFVCLFNNVKKEVR